jgi:leucyl aminopeptidase
MKFSISTQPTTSIKSDIELIFVINKAFDHAFVNDGKALKKLSFKAEQNEICFIQATNRLYVGADSLNHTHLRDASASAIRFLNKYTFSSLIVATYVDECPTRNIKAVIEGLLLGDYVYDRYKSKKADHPIEKVTVVLENYGEEKVSRSDAKKAIDEAVIITKAMNTTRTIVNTPPDDFFPKTMAKKAKRLAASNNLEINILNHKDLQNEHMNAFLAVGRASKHKPYLVHVSYKPKKPLFTVSLIGKGLTYDSGGLSLKPSTAMVSMKMDKAGSATIFGIMQAISELQLPIEVHGFMGMAENMVDGGAYKPDDVLTSKSGTTIEVQNTDAEGRLVLADTLTYAQENVNADYIFDLATLTGACVVALGEYTTGIMGHSMKIKHQLFSAASSTGEFVGSLPFNDHLKATLKSSIADISNISSSRYGGAITAALFLDKFITEENKEKWMHLDIAGSAYNAKGWGINPGGATGSGVRLLLKWMQHRIKEETK